MATYLSNRDSNGYTNENGHFRLPLKMLDGEVFSGFAVTANTTPNMNVNIAAGEAKIPYQDYAYATWSDASTSVAIGTSSASAPRIDRIVAYIDRTMSFTTSHINNPGALKFKVVAGTAATNATPPTDSQVQTSVGAGNPWINIAQVTVPMGATSITNGNIDNSVKTNTSINPNVKLPEITTSDGDNIRFVVMNDAPNLVLPNPITNVTQIVFIVRS